MLCDMGCEFYCYASDITNSFPAKPAAELKTYTEGRAGWLSMVGLCSGSCFLAKLGVFKYCGILWQTPA